MRKLSVSAAEAVGHLHLGQIEVLRAALRFQGHAVQQKAGSRRIHRGEIEGNVRTGCAILASIGIRLTLPVHELIRYRFVVLTEITANCLHKR